jgi:hypothetical protein
MSFASIISTIELGRIFKKLEESDIFERAGSGSHDFVVLQPQK